MRIDDFNEEIRQEFVDAEMPEEMVDPIIAMIAMGLDAPAMRQAIATISKEAN